jgi:hypothetical protein
MKQMSANNNMATWYNPTAIYRFLVLGPGINSVGPPQNDGGGGYGEKRLVGSAEEEHSLLLSL